MWHPVYTSLHLCLIWELTRVGWPKLSNQEGALWDLSCTWHAVLVTREWVCLGLSYACGNESVCSFSRSQLVWLLFQQQWLMLVPLLVLLVGFPWSRPDVSWSSVAERKNPIAGCTASISKEV